MSVMVVMLARADNTGPELRRQCAGVAFDGKPAIQTVTVVLREGRRCMKLRSYATCDSGHAVAKGLGPVNYAYMGSAAK